ncbi:unnamed protein product, partial [Rotaria sordida]
PRVYSAPFQVTQQDQKKLYRAISQQVQQLQTEDDSGRSTDREQDSWESDQPYNSPGTRPTWLISSNETNFVDTDDDEKSDSNDYISDVKNNENENTETADTNENNTLIEKSPWYYPDDHDSRYDSYQTEPVEPDRNAAIATVTTTVSHWNYNDILRGSSECFA